MRNHNHININTNKSKQRTEETKGLYTQGDIMIDR